MTQIYPKIVRGTSVALMTLNHGRIPRLRDRAFRNMAGACFVFTTLFATSNASFGQTINVNNAADYGNAIQTIDSNPNSSYTLNFLNGFTMNQAVGDFNSNTSITLTGNSKTIDGASQFQPLVVDSGTVTLQSLNVINPGSPITVNGGTLIDTTGSLQGPITNNGSVKFNVGTGTSYTYSGNMSGTGDVTISGTVPVTFSGVNTYTGGTTVDVNSKLIGTTHSLTGPITDNWIVNFNQSTAGTFSGAIKGTGGVEISNSGMITLTGANTYGGGTLVDQGSMLSGTTSSLQGAIYNYGLVQFNQSTTGTYAGAMSGLGMVQITGGGTVTFTGLNTYAGGTQVDQGSTLIGSTSSLQGQFLDNGHVTFNQSAAGTFSGSIGGAGVVEIQGGGPVTFSGTNNYTGGTIVDANNTLIGTTGSLQGTIADSGLVQFNQATNGTFNGTITGSGSVEISGAGPIQFTGTTSTYSGGTIIDNGSTLGASTATLQGAVQNQGSLLFNVSSTSVFGGNISSSGSVEIKDNITATLSGTNTYTGGTKVDNGATLIGSTYSIQGNVVNNGAVQFNSNLNPPLNTPGFPPPITLPIEVGPVMPGSIIIQNPFNQGPPYYYSGNMSGTGSVKITGNSQIFFMGTNTYTGGTTIDAGSSLTGDTSNLRGSITNNGTLEFWQSIPGNYSGNISGTGGVVVASSMLTSGALTLSGTNTYTGGTTLESGMTLTGTTSSLQGAITNDGNLQFMQTGIGTYSGNMTGTGSVEVGGGGQVTFSGTNNYTGGTTVDAGTTLVGNQQSLLGTIVDNGLIKLSETSNVSAIMAAISGTGGVEIVGTTPVIIQTTNTYTGGTTIDNGSTLYVGAFGSLAGNINVNSGGTLTGPGTVGNVTVNAGGTIFPNSPPIEFVSTGNQSPGTAQSDAIAVPSGGPMQITGNFVQGAGSKYSVELNPGGPGDKLNIGGTAQINNGTVLNLVLDPGHYTVGTKYNILSAAGGLNGTYSFVSTTPTTQSIAFTEQYNPTNLQVTVNSDLAPLTHSANQFSLASAIDRSSGMATGDYANAVTQLTMLGPGALSTALNQMSGDIIPSISTIQRQTTTAQMQLLSNRLANLTLTGSPSGRIARTDSNIRFVSSQGGRGQSPDDPADAPAKDLFGWTTWAQGYGLGGNIGGDGNAGGTNYRLGGTLFGAERWMTENLMVGVLGGYAGTSVGNHQAGSNAQINSYQVGLYELYRQDLLYVSNIDAFNDNQINVTRPIDDGTIVQTASGKTNGSQWSHYSETGATFEFDELRVQPFLGLQYMYLDQGGYTESGAGSLDMTTSHQTVNSFRNGVGVRLYQEATFGNVLVVPSIAARYQHEWGNGTQLITSSLAGAPSAQFTTSGNHTGRDFGFFTLGATAYVTERFSIYTTLDTQVASSFFALVGSGGVQYSW